MAIASRSLAEPILVALPIVIPNVWTSLCENVTAPAVAITIESPSPTEPI